MNKLLINFDTLIKKPSFIHLVGSGSLFLSQIEGGDLTEIKIEFSEEENNFSEYFYKLDETKSALLIKISETERTLPLFSTLYHKEKGIKNKWVKLYPSQNFSVCYPYKLIYSENDLKFTINPKTDELYVVIDVNI